MEKRSCLAGGLLDLTTGTETGAPAGGRFSIPISEAVWPVANPGTYLAMLVLPVSRLPQTNR